MPLGAAPRVSFRGSGGGSFLTPSVCCEGRCVRFSHCTANAPAPAGRQVLTQSLTLLSHLTPTASRRPRRYVGRAQRGWESCPRPHSKAMAQRASGSSIHALRHHCPSFVTGRGQGNDSKLAPSPSGAKAGRPLSSDPASATESPVSPCLLCPRGSCWTSAGPEVTTSYR